MLCEEEFNPTHQCRRGGFIQAKRLFHTAKEIVLLVDAAVVILIVVAVNYKLLYIVIKYRYLRDTEDTEMLLAHVRDNVDTEVI